MFNPKNIGSGKGLRFALAKAVIFGLICLSPFLYSPTALGSLNFSRHMDFTSALQKWGLAMMAIISNGDLKLDEFEKIDFSNPIDNGYLSFLLDSSFEGDETYSFFSDKGKFKKYPTAEKIEQRVIDLMTTRTGVKPVFNLRRVEKDGNITDRLVVIVPHADPQHCPNTLEEGTIHFPLVLAKDNREIVKDLQSLWSCTWAPDGGVYLVFLISQRVKHKGSDQWTIY